MSYLSLVKEYTPFVPPFTLVEDVEGISPGSIDVMRQVIEYHFPTNREGQLAVCAIGAAFICAEKEVKKKIQSPDISDKEREIFRLFLIYDKVETASKQSRMLEELVDTL